MGSVTVFLGIGRLVSRFAGDWGSGVVGVCLLLVSDTKGLRAAAEPLLTAVRLVLVNLRQGSGVLQDSDKAIPRSRLVPILAETAD